MRMRQSVAEIEEAFAHETSREREQRESVRRAAELRTRKRQAERRNKRGFARFVLLAFTLIMTAAIVTVVMFRTLYLLLS
jgi:hypothetical protein